MDLTAAGVSVEINDIRTESEFRGITFSGFKKVDVKKELLASLLASKVEPACYWTAELLCAGHLYDLWETLFLFYTKNIHLGNVKIASYLELRLNDFKSIVNSGFCDYIFGLRNNSKIRRLFAEIVCILCEAKRRHSFDQMKIKADDFDMTQMRERFKATSNDYADNVFLSEDPKELVPAINEIAFSITEEVRNQMNACYWLEWILEFETVCKAKKQRLVCERRTFAKVEHALQKDVIWMVWDTLLQEGGKRSRFIQKTLDALLSLFVVKYTTGCHKKRRNLLYFAVALLCEQSIPNEDLIRPSQLPVMACILRKIDSVYKQIKKNEVSPATEYLFHGVKSANLEQTIEKLEKLRSFEESFVPHIAEPAVDI